jgi:hypothetical protein
VAIVAKLIVTYYHYSARMREHESRLHNTGAQ